MPQLQREGDITIMDMLIPSGHSKEVLEIMNACRLYLQVLYLSDIMTADGKTLPSWVSRPPQNYSSRSRLKWLYQVRPDQEKWDIWRLTLFYSIGIITDRHNVWHLNLP